MMKKVIITVGVIAVAVIGVFVYLSSSGKQNIIRFGATFPLTGEVASYGISAQKGILLRIDEINQAGGINDKKVKIDFQDDKNSVKDAVNIFNAFAKIKKYPVVFGSAGSTVSLALVPISLKEKVILISPISGSSKLSSPEWKYFFRTIPSDAEQAEKLADWVISDGVRNVAVIYTSNSWGKPLADAFSSLFAAQGGTVVFTEGTPENISDFRTIIARLNQHEFDAIVSPTYPKEGGLLVKQLMESGVNTKLYGGDNWGAPEFLTIAGTAAEGVNFTFPSESNSPLWDNFVKNYQAKFKEEPDIFAAYAYDATSAIIEAIKKSGQISSEEIRAQLLLLSFEGVTGQISFRENGDIDAEGYGKRTIRNGQAVSVE